MTDHTVGTGAAGTLTIRDTGTGVEFWISCSDPYTNTGSLGWSGVVNGAGVGGVTSFPAGIGSRLLGVWGVYTSQTVSLHMDATGTSGLGGPADLAAGIPRGPAATVPPAPTMDPPTEVTTTSMRVNFHANGDGGSALIASELTYADNQDFTGAVVLPSGGSNVITGLAVGTRYWFTARTRNAVGWSAYAPARADYTLSGVRVWNGTAWVVAEARVWNGTAWVTPEIRLWNGTAWVQTG